MTTISDLLIKIGVKAEGLDKYKKKLEELGDEGEDAGKKVSDGAEKGEKSVKALGKAADVSSSALGTMAKGVGAIFAAGAALFALIEQVAGVNDAQTKLAAATGLSTNEFERLAFAAKQSGIEESALSKDILVLRKNLEIFANTGAGPAGTALSSLGLSLADLNGESAENQLGILSESLMQVGDDAQQAIIAAQLFGEEGGPKMASLLAEGADGIKALGDQAAHIDLDKRANFTAFIDQIGRAKEAGMALMVQVLEPLLPVILSLGEKIGGLVQKLADTGVLDKLSETITVLLDVVVEAIDQIFPLIEEIIKGGLLDSILDTIKLLGPVITNLISIILPFLSNVIGAIKFQVDLFNIVLSVMSKILGVVTDLIAGFRDWFSSIPFVQDIADGMSAVADQVSSLASALGIGTQKAKELDAALGSIGAKKLYGKAEDFFGEKTKGIRGKLEAEDSRRKAIDKEQKQGQRRDQLLSKGKSLKKEKKGLTKDEVTELITLGVDEKTAQGLGVKTGGGGKGKKKEVTSDVSLEDSILAIRTGSNDPKALAALAKTLSAKTPSTKDIKPTVAIDFWNFQVTQNIKGTSDPKATADMSTAQIVKTFKKATAKAGQSLAGTLVG